MNIKKTLAWILVLAMTFTLLFSSVLPVSAASSAKFTVANVTNAVKGQTVAVNVSVNGTLAGFEGSLVYDSSVLTLKSIEMHDKFPSGLTGNNVSQRRFNYAATTNITVNSVAFICTFTVASNAANGKYNISLKDRDDASKEMSAFEIIGPKEVKTFTPTVTNGSITVVTAPTSVTVSPKELFLETKETATLKATIAPSNFANKTVTWSTSNSAVAKVSSSGVVTAVETGKAIITATTQVGGKKDTCVVMVTPRAMPTRYVSMRVGKTKAIQTGTLTTIDDVGTKPFKISGKTMLPLRFVGVKMGGTVTYINDNQPIIMSYGTKKVEFKLNSKTMTVYDGTKKTTITLDVAAQKKSAKTYIPLRAIAQALGFQVYYENGTEYIIVANPKMSDAVLKERLAEAKKYF